jgi:signal transduction histidine kinase/CheY-like chemotaxis protein
VVESPRTPVQPRGEPLAWDVSAVIAALATIVFAILWAAGILAPLASGVLIFLSIVAIYGLYGALRQARRSLERVSRAELMYEAGRRLSGTLVIDEIYDALRELIQQAMPCDGMIISSYDPNARLVRCVYGWVPGGRFDHTALPPIAIKPDGTGMQTEVIRTGEGRLYGDVRERVRRPGSRYFDVSPGGTIRDLSKPGAAPPGARCALMVPVKLEGKVVGIVQMMCDTVGAYQARHLTILESLVTPLAVALQNAELYARIREADRHKDEFLATLAHELRNPLAPIRTAVALMGQQGLPASRTHWCRDVIERQVGHMARLLDDLLDVGRISRGALPLRRERVELAEVMRHAVEASEPLILEKGHHLTFRLPTTPIVLHADPTRIAQVISNLLNNAARYSDPGGRIWLTAEVEGSDAGTSGEAGAGGGAGAGGAASPTGEAIVRVRDSGIGIDADLISQIFEPFHQIDRSLESSRGGLGIGLTLVKRVVELHGGRVEARSAGPGKGSEFAVRLPLSLTEPASTAPAASESGPAQTVAGPVAPHAGTNGNGNGNGHGHGNGNGHGRKGAKHPIRILVADDLPDSADSLALILENMGHKVRVAYDGSEAVSVAREFRPEVIFLDIGMPKVNGYDAARQIRAQATERPVLVALTGWGREENRQRTREAGFDHHLVKPVDLPQLAEIVESRLLVAK